MSYAPLLDELRGLRWPARRRVPGVLPGAHPARLRGPGGEFSEYRAYRQGDDPRRLDWRLLARSDRAYVRLADDHALLPTVCVVDASLSMAYPDAETVRGDAGRLRAPQVRTKWQAACALAVGLAGVAHAAGDPVGLVVGGRAGDGRDMPRVLAPRSRRGVVLELARALDATTPAAAGGLAALMARVPGGVGTRVVLIGDFLDDDPGAARRAAAAHVAGGGEVYAVHVVAAEEVEPPPGLRVAVDPEDARVRRAMDAGARAEYAARFAEWRLELARAWRGAGAAYALVRTDEPAGRVVRRVVQGATGDGAAA
ncbi:hypothetical protein tb265_15240 [Gemmatimonadetes bacterium T265]|nr:hypothetical protein tb265_15240 [Gemmatimonadetes bacterium T265]